LFLGGEEDRNGNLTYAAGRKDPEFQEWLRQKRAARKKKKTGT
jgi:hypothetical protein